MEVLTKDGSPTKELFIFLKYNQIVNSIDGLPAQEDELYKEFCKKWNGLIENFSKGVSASSQLGSIASMFGFKRHYCATCGLPIIGGFSKIESNITCNPCFQSFKIIQAMEKREELISKGELNA